MMYAAVVQYPARVKSPEAFRTISEVANELDVPQHVLRFWESRFTQVKPTKRAGGRRYYRPEDIDLLRGIRTLLYSDGYTIKGVQKVLRERGLRYVAELGRDSVSDMPVPPVEADEFDEPAPAPVAEPRERSVLRFEQRAPALAREEREKLEILLAELLGLKQRLRAAKRH